MSEKQFWKHLRENLPFKTYRVENKVMIGMPDVHYINKGNSGWIELKYMPSWKSKRVSTGYQLHQALWAKEHIKHGGTNWIMVRVDREFIGLIHGKNSVELYNRPTMRDFLDMCMFYKRGKMDKDNWAELSHTILHPFPSKILV